MNYNNQSFEYEVLHSIPFIHDRKRGQIIIKSKLTNDIILYTMGSDFVVEKFVKEIYLSDIRKICTETATTGFRTLLVTMKVIKEEDFLKWNKLCELNESDTKLNASEKKKKFYDLISELENNLDFLCITGIENQLQLDVENTIRNIIADRIKLWILTGDKLETTISIGVKIGLISTNRGNQPQRVYIIKEQTTKPHFLEKLYDYYTNHSKNILLLDGASLDIALNYTKDTFFQITKHSPGVLCCNCSPEQKFLLVKYMKEYSNKVCLVIGNNKNDVDMLREASVSVGLHSSESRHASAAADYSITKFNQLNKLIFGFGKMSYINVAKLVNICIYFSFLHLNSLVSRLIY